MCLGGIIALGVGVNMWSASECVENFKKFAYEAFRPQFGAGIPIFGTFISWWTDSCYSVGALEKALQAAFSSPYETQRFLFGQPYTYSSNEEQQSGHRDLKVGVTAVTTLTNEATVISNYNRKVSKDGQLHPRSFCSVCLLILSRRTTLPRK